MSAHGMAAAGAQDCFRSGVDTLAADPRARAARKLPQAFQVRFAPAGESIATLEGPVAVAPGDAIVTGPAGELWPVSRARFAAKYAPQAPGQPYADGTYLSLVLRVLALRVAVPFTVVLADGASRLQGQAGDYLIDYGDDSLGVVAQDLFARLYETLAVPAPAPVGVPALHALIRRLLLTGRRVPNVGVATPPAAPGALRWLIAACRPSHGVFNARAIRFGDRYRSAYWAIYLLSAVAALLATLPAALGWDQSTHGLHSYAGVWGAGEVLVIAVVGLLYWRGHRQDWQGLWLRARTHAELSWYLPLVAPLVDFSRPHPDHSWYARVFNPGQHLREANEIDALCAQLEQPARTAQQALWSDPEAVRAYGAWSVAILRAQYLYHQRVAAEQHALQHRVHHISTTLFLLTACGAALHLVWHSLWLTMVTVFFPALGAALHGALAQSEAFRLEQASRRLAQHLAQVIADIERALAADTLHAVKVAEAVQAAVAVILDEHQDWHGAVRPHHIPLA